MKRKINIALQYVVASPVIALGLLTFISFVIAHPMIKWLERRLK